jgi:hypothetical protein
MKQLRAFQMMRLWGRWKSFDFMEDFFLRGQSSIPPTLYLYLISESKPIKISCHWDTQTLSRCHFFLFLLRQLLQLTGVWNEMKFDNRQAWKRTTEGEWGKGGRGMRGEAHRAENKTSIKRKSINFFVLFSRCRVSVFWERNKEKMKLSWGGWNSRRALQSH